MMSLGAGGDMRGKKVSKDEILKELGNPRGWGALHRKSEFEMRLWRGEKELRLSGIIGHPGHKGYLKFLYEQLKTPFGSNTGLVSEKENERIAESERVQIRKEIEKHLKQLREYLQSPEKVREYVGDLERALVVNGVSMKLLGPEGEYDEVEKSFEELRVAVENNRKMYRLERGHLIRAIGYWKKRLKDFSKPQ